MKHTSHSAQIPLAIAIVLGVGISLGGCAAEPAGNGSGPESSQADQGAASDTGDKAPADDAGSQGFVDPDGDVPDWVAAGFPIYPGSEVAASAEAGDITIISFSVPSSDEETIYDWFVDQYSQSGWTASNLDNEHGSFEADDADGRTSSINVTGATYVMSVTKG